MDNRTNLPHKIHLMANRADTSQRRLTATSRVNTASQRRSTEIRPGGTK